MAMHDQIGIAANRRGEMAVILHRERVMPQRPRIVACALQRSKQRAPNRVRNRVIVRCIQNALQLDRLRLRA